MALTEETEPLGDDAKSQVFCPPQSPRDDSELQRFISYDPPVQDPKDPDIPAASDPRSQFTHGPDINALEPPEDSISRTFTSFGENGTTASVSAFGDIMQIMRYLGVGKSGFFCVDMPDQYQPYFVVARAWSLLGNSTDISKGIGLAIQDPSDWEPRLDFIHDRWPRYRWTTERLSVSIQYTVRDGVVIQKYNIQKRSEDATTFGLQYKGITIRQMEWMEENNQFNLRTPEEPSSEDHRSDHSNPDREAYQTRFGPNRHSLNLIHRFDGLVRQRESKENQTMKGAEEVSGAQPSDPNSIPTSHPDITVRQDNDGSRRKEEVEKENEEAITHASMEAGAVGLVIGVFVNNKAQQFEEDSSMSINMPKELESLEITVAYRLQLLSSNQNGWKASLISASEICEPPLYRTPGHSPPSFSPNRSLDFTIRRNLEHILSVCSINTATEFTWDNESRLFVESAAKDSAFALTCGDFSGHYIVSSASFFAFRFLLEIFKFLRSTGSTNLSQEPSRATSEEMVEPQPMPKPRHSTQTDPEFEKSTSDGSILYCKQQCDRIFNVCKGHLTWVFQTAWKENRPHFGGNHWASGDPIIFPPDWPSVWKPSPSLADTPFQIIKAFEFAKCWSDDEDAKRNSKSQSEGKGEKTSQNVPIDPASGRESTNLDPTSEANVPDTADNVLEHGPTVGPESGKRPKSPSLMSNNEPNVGPRNASDFFNGWDFAKSLVASKVKPWVDDLAQKNKRTKFAFSRAAEDGVRIFRLEDHVWIWMALRCLEDFKLDSELTPTPSDLLSVEQRKKITSKDAQKNMIRRFTLEESFLRQRLLATSRTVRESRFLFRSRDTALFYGMESGFFRSDQSRSAPWMSTIEIQKGHDHNDDAKWQNPLRYGLAMIMTSPSHEWQINRKPAHAMFHDAAMILLYSARSNGLFPGEFDQESKDPLIFSEENYRNSYWNSCFELPYIFWVYGKQSLDKKPEAKPSLPVHDNGEKLGDRFQTVQSTTKYEHENISTSPVQLLEGSVQNAIQNRGESDPQNKADSDTQKRIRNTQAAIDALTFKKTMPFNDFIDQRSVVEPSDEWLYSFPDFLDFDPQIKTWENLKPRIQELLDPNKSDRHSTIVAKGARSFLQSFESREKADATLEDDFPTRTDVMGRTMVADVAKSKQQKKGSLAKFDQSDDPCVTNEELWKMFNQVRSEQEAKKRLILLLSPNETTALLCYLGSPESQRDTLSDFFDRHHRYEKYLFDDTIAAQNVWETELHLSFYQLLDTSRDTKKDEYVLPPFREITDPVLDGKVIVRAAIGFLFFGDFLDRYWTCHVLQCTHVKHYAEGTSRLRIGSEPWKQRKFLELEWFDIILSKMLEGVHDILRALNIQDEQPHALSGFSSNDYFQSRNRWQSWQHILQLLEQDLKENLEHIESWQTREADRGQERPRWTKNDERKYRGPINNMLRSNERKVRRLKAYHTQIQSWRSNLSNTQQTVRDDLNLRGAEDIRFFTYVTVVFLPLGFAASIFSMGESPSTAVLNSMIVTAVTALLLTVLALVSAKTISTFVSGLFRGFWDIVGSTTSSSFLYQHYRRQTQQPPTSAGAGFRRNPILPNILHGLWLCWFWVAYITQELPGRQFGIAYKACQRWYPEGTRQPALLQWAASALHTGAWVLRLPLKLGIVFAICLSHLVCWGALSLKRLYLTLKSPIAFIVAMILFPVFTVSYVVNIMWLNIYDTALWTASKQSTKSKTRSKDQLQSNEPTKETPTGVSTQQDDHLKSEKPSHQGGSLERFLLYSRASRPLQKYESKEKPGEEASKDSETMDMRKAMRKIFDKPPRWPERKKKDEPSNV